MDSPYKQNSLSNEYTTSMVLQSLQLEKYQQIFTKKALPLETFAHMTAGDLNYIGMTDVEDQKVFLDGLKHFNKTIKEAEPPDSQKIIGNAVHQLYLISSRMTNLRRKLDINPRPRNTLVEPSVPTTTAIIEFLKIIKDQLDYAKTDLISAMPFQNEKIPSRIFYFRRAIAFGIITALLYTSIRLFRQK